MNNTFHWGSAPLPGMPDVRQGIPFYRKDFRSAGRDTSRRNSTALSIKYMNGKEVRHTKIMQGLPFSKEYMAAPAFSM
jgi:hypothetical protein